MCQCMQVASACSTLPELPPPASYAASTSCLPPNISSSAFLAASCPDSPGVPGLQQHKCIPQRTEVLAACTSFWRFLKGLKLGPAPLPPLAFIIGALRLCTSLPGRYSNAVCRRGHVELQRCDKHVMGALVLGKQARSALFIYFYCCSGVLDSAGQQSLILLLAMHAHKQQIYSLLRNNDVQD